MINVAIFHNILWSRYKGVVFSSVYKLSSDNDVAVNFFQIAETDNQRKALNPVDLTYHNYPYTLLFKGGYENISTYKLIFRLCREISLSKADLIIIPGFHRIEYWAMLLFCMVLGRRRAVFCDSTLNDNPFVLWKALAKRFFFKFCDGYFAYGERSRNFLLKHGAKLERIYIRCQAAALPIGYSPEDALLDRSKILNTQGSGSNFLYVGRLSPEKNLETLICAFAEYLKTSPNASLTFVGGGPLDSSLRKLVESKAIRNVKFIGGVTMDDLTPYYISASALILPSTSEPWGLVVNEALSFGCPVVVSEVCGCVPELVVDGVTGYSFSTKDVGSLVLAMQRVSDLILKDPDLAKKCIDHIHGFSADRAGAQIISGCKNIVRG